MAANSPQPEPVAWAPPTYYAHVDPVTGETRLVDSTGTQLSSPPPFNRIVNGDVRFEDPWGNDIPVYEPPTTGIHLWVDADGTPRVVDEHGYEVPSPPAVVRDGNGEWIVKAADGTAVDVPTFVRPTRNLFVHVDADGTPSVVDGFGNQVPSPPHVYRDGNDPTWRVMGTEDTIDTYRPPPETEMFVYTNADGTPSIVDSDGIPVPCPPIVWRDGADPTWRIQGGEGEIPPYVPPTTGFLVYESPDGSYQVVDRNGQLIASPPLVRRDSIGDDFVFDGPDGQPVHVPPYQPPTTGIYIHESPDGTFQVVDANGNLVPSPPAVYHDHETGTYAVAGADGPGPHIPPLWPPAGEPPETWPPAVGEEPAPTTEEEEEEEEEVPELGDVPDDAAASDPTQAVPPDQPAEEPTDAARGPVPERAAGSVEEAGALDASAEDTGPEASAIGLEADELSTLASTDEVSATPIPLPEPPPPPTGDDLTEVAADPGDGVQTMPVTTPIPSGDEVSATPITLPGTATQAADEVSATPIPLPEPPPPPTGDDLTEVAADPGDGVQTMPVTTPIPSGDEVSATPITLPGTATQAADEVSATPIPLPGTATQAADEVSATPITLPGTATPVSDDVAAEIGQLPVPVPEPVVEEPDFGGRSDVFDDVEVFEPTLVEETADDELAE